MEYLMFLIYIPLILVGLYYLALFFTSAFIALKHHGKNGLFYISKWLTWSSIIIIRYPLAIYAVLFHSTPDKLHLTKFRVLETIDNDLTGDSGWRDEHLTGHDPLSAKNRIRWLWRNGGNRFNYEVLGCKAGETDPKYWIYRKYFKIGSKWMLELYFGWALTGPQKGLCKYVCTIRMKTKA